MAIKRLIYFVVIITLISCENDIEVIKSFSSDQSMPSQSMINAEIVHTDSGRIQFRIEAPEIHNYTRLADNYLEFPLGVIAEFYNISGEVESNLSAKYAIHFTDKELWEAKDSVVVVNKEGEILNTEQLFWDEKAKRIYSNRFVKVTRPNEIIMGEGFESDDTFTVWKIRQVQGTIYIQDDD